MNSTNSGRACVRGWVAALAALGLYAAANFAQAANQQLSGVWRIERSVFEVRTIDGKTPPLKPQAAKLYAERQSARKAGDTSFDSATWCASVGLPRILFIDYPFQIVVREPYVAFLHQWNWWARVVYFDGALTNSAAAMTSGPPGAGPGGSPGATPGGAAGDPKRPPAANKAPFGPMGLSKGKWDGNTLQIETGDFSHLTMLDSAGMPHSAALKITERVSLRNPDVLENRIRIEDPEVFTEAWETLVTYRRQPNAVIEEDVCLDRVKNNQPAVKE